MLSLKPSEMGSGGGLWSDLDATITGAKFIETAFGKPENQKVTVFELSVTDNAGEEHEQLLSTGKGNIPTRDGESLDGSKEVNVGSNFGIFITSVVTAGFPENKLEDKVGVLVGLNAHFERVAAPKRSGLSKAPRADGKVYEDTVLIVTKINTLPWDAKSKKGVAPKGKGVVAAPKTKGGDGDEVAGVAKEAINVVLLENMEGVTKQQLAKGVFAQVGTNPNKAAIVKLCIDDAFLMANWTLENGVVTM